MKTSPLTVRCCKMCCIRSTPTVRRERTCCNPTHRFLAHLNFLHFHLFRWKIVGPILTKLGTKHPWVKRIQVCYNEGSCPYLRRCNNRIAKLHLRNLKKKFSKTTGPISTEHDAKHPSMKGTQVFFYKLGPSNFQKGDMSFCSCCLLLFYHLTLEWSINTKRNILHMFSLYFFYGGREDFMGRGTVARSNDFSSWHPRASVNQMLIIICGGHTTAARSSYSCIEFICATFSKL